MKLYTNPMLACGTNGFGKCAFITFYRLNIFKCDSVLAKSHQIVCRIGSGKKQHM